MDEQGERVCRICFRALLDPHSDICQTCKVLRLELEDLGGGVFARRDPDSGIIVLSISYGRAPIVLAPQTARRLLAFLVRALLAELPPESASRQGAKA